MVISSVQSLSRVWLSETPWTTTHQASLSITNSCPSSWWCHPTISFSVVPFSSCPQSFPASGVFSNESYGGGGGLVAKLCLTLVGPGTIALQAPLSMGFSGKNTRVDCHFLLQGIFPTQESNLGLLQCRQILYQLSYEGSPKESMGDCTSLFSPV